MVVFSSSWSIGIETWSLLLSIRSMLHESAAFSGVLSHSCPTRRATRFAVSSHKISTSREESHNQLARRIEVLFRSTVHPVKWKKHSGITQRRLLVCFLPTRKEEIQIKKNQKIVPVWLNAYHYQSLQAVNASLRSSAPNKDLENECYVILDSAILGLRPNLVM
jgi:hypothetical protein